MDLLVWIVLFSLIGGALSAIAASVFLLLNESLRTRLVPHLVSFAIGALLGAAFLALLPHAVEPLQMPPQPGSELLSITENMVYGLQKTIPVAVPALSIHKVFLLVLGGILGFFLLERLVIWRHCHSDHCHAHSTQESIKDGKNKSTITLILVGDGIHNLVDGIVIAAAFLNSIHVGIVTTIALAAHEIPQEVGDFAILLNSGMKRMKAFLFNTLASLTTVIGAVVAYFSLGAATSAISYVLAIAASSFIYIAMADLIPGLHERSRMSDTVKQLVLIASGIGTIYIAHAYLH